MKPCRILSPVPKGSGAFVLHHQLGQHISGYKVKGYSPKLEYLPLLLPVTAAFEQADIVHTVPDYALFFQKKGTPLILTAHHYMCDGRMDPYSSILQKIHYRTDLKWFILRSIAKADMVTAVSRYTAEHVRRELRLKTTIRVIYNGIDCDRFRPKKENRQGPGIRVLFSGNPTRRKGFHWIPAIAERLNSGITISCTGGLRNRKPAMEASSFRYLGPQPSSEMPNLYRSHDILLSPTVREGFGLAVAEAMACGLPVVASDCSAIPELVDHGKGGFLCPVGDVDCFAARINQLAESPSLREEMGEYNRAKVEKHFQMERMVTQYCQLFEEVLDRRR